MELRLISGSSRRDFPECDVTFNVPMLVQSLPEWRQWGDVTPFRDRIVMDKLFLTSCVQSHLREVIKRINDELFKKKATFCTDDMKTSNIVLSVGVTCVNGTQISQCYVEKLHEIYLFKPPMENLTVKRQHKQPLLKKLSDEKHFVWQYTKLSVKYLHALEDLNAEKAWTAFPFHLAPVIEEEFTKDPINTKLELPHKTGVMYILNFETGEMYSTHDKRTHRIRCKAVGRDDWITCQMLADASYRSISRHYNAAGILFYSFHPITGETVFLLGQMTYGVEKWCDFGGLREFREYPRETAARECSEETLGVLGDSRYLLLMLEDYKTNNVFKVVNQNSSYVSHFVRIPYEDYPSQFQKVLLDGRNTIVEVDQLRWFGLSSLTNAIERVLYEEARIVACPVFEDGATDILSPCPLRYEFLLTLCIAKKLNFLHCIQHITRKLYLQSNATMTNSETTTDQPIVSQSDSGNSPHNNHVLKLEKGLKSLEFLETKTSNVEAITEAQSTTASKEEVKEKQSLKNFKKAGDSCGLHKCELATMQCGMGAGEIMT